MAQISGTQLEQHGKGPALLQKTRFRVCKECLAIFISALSCTSFRWRGVGIRSVLFYVDFSRKLSASGFAEFVDGTFLTHFLV